MNTMLIQFFAAFGMVFCKGFQQQNVIGGKYGHAIYTSYLMAVFEVAVVSTSVVAGWDSIIPVGTGGALGVISSMYFYRRIHKEK